MGMRILEKAYEPVGRIAAYRCPPGLSAESFMAISPELVAKNFPTEKEAHNVIVNAWWSDVFQQMIGSVSNLQVTVLALGNGTNPSPARTDTTLLVEFGRYLIVSATSIQTDPPSATFSFFMPAADGAFSITEVGLFAGGASLALHSGRIVSHAAYSLAKNANSDYRVDYTITRPST